ncbi:hypothetical protein [Mangrovivirga cuniculi]|uniref:Uncharacterized protein n=1 Tax=Mangrovivirga cuniculi TaxID=2715131 RepID=A0A4D7JK10_9BACT|nr:hypothetical protein [Mangrovivirga cuniculi]QCK16289.1 hypothetical protein DCC35_16860 [Mangrovivirga cuniculi]
MFNSLKSKLKKIILLEHEAINSLYEEDIKRKIIFSNIVFLSLPIVYAIFMAVDYQVYLMPFDEMRFDQLVVPIIIFICLSGLILNYYNRIFLSRIAFIISWPILLHLLPIILLKSPKDYFFAYPAGIIFHSILIQLMFSRPKEPFLFYPLLLLNFLLLINISFVLELYDSDFDIPDQMTGDKYYLYDGILYWLLFNLVIFYIQKVVEGFIDRLNSSKSEIEIKKNQLDELNRNLEVAVKERTSELEIQNERLKKHAFYNAHLLRGPFCRVFGLINLQKIYRDNKMDHAEIDEKLFPSLHELDTRIKEIQRILEKDNLSKK